MRGRHSEVEDAGREVAPQLWHAALAAAPVTAVLAAVGAGAAGYFTHNADLAAVGALAGAAGAAAESARTRSNRVRARDERAALRDEVRTLAAAVERLSNEINARPAVLRPEPMPTFALAAPGSASMPVAATFASPAEPATPRSLPILTANHRGLQSSRPDPQPVPALVEVAPAVATSAIARLVAETPRRPGVEVDDEPTVQIPRLATAPAHWTPAEPLPSLALPAVGAAAPRLILGGDRSALPLPRPPATPIGGLLLPALPPVAGSLSSELRVIDLRSSSRHGTRVEARSVEARSVEARSVQPAGLARRGRSARTVDVVEPVSLFEPVRPQPVPGPPQPVGPDRHGEAVSLFEPRPRAGRPGAFPAPPDPAAADGARHAWRGMRPGVPPSPFFTPGAFEGSPRTA